MNIKENLHIIYLARESGGWRKNHIIWWILFVHSTVTSPLIFWINIFYKYYSVYNYFIWNRMFGHYWEIIYWHYWGCFNELIIHKFVPKAHYRFKIIYSRIIIYQQHRKYNYLQLVRYIFQRRNAAVERHK